MAAFLAACGGGGSSSSTMTSTAESKPTNEGGESETEQFGKGDIGININALGTVTSLATVTVRTQISGYLMKIDFTEGVEVKKGDVLAEIDPRPYEAALAQALPALPKEDAEEISAWMCAQQLQNGCAALTNVACQQVEEQKSEEIDFAMTNEALARVLALECHNEGKVDYLSFSEAVENDTIGAE